MDRKILKQLGIAIVVTVVLSGCNGHFGSKKPLPKIDYILVEKKRHTISVFNDNRKLATYYVSLGKSPVGHKEREGDHKTPEGVYSIVHKDPKAQHFKALTLSYPNKRDIENAAKKGVSPGYGIQIHGYSKHPRWLSQKNHPRDNVTRGCILLTNPEMEQIFKAAQVGTKVEIRA